MISEGDYRILIVEDNPAWSKALWDMYRDLFKTHPNTASSKKEAVEMLKTEDAWDIVSIDLNLVGDKSLDNYTDPTDYLVGQDILHLIYKSKSSKFVVCCTGIQRDKQIMGILKEDKTGLIRRTLVDLPGQLNNLFSRRNIFLHKNDILEIDDNIIDFKEIISREKETIDIACGRIGILNLDETSKCLHISYWGEKATITFPQGMEMAHYIAFILAHPFSKYKKMITSRELIRLKYEYVIPFSGQETTEYENEEEFNKGRFGEEKIFYEEKPEWLKIIEGKSKKQFQEFKEEVEEKIEVARESGDLEAVEIFMEMHNTLNKYEPKKEDPKIEKEIKSLSTYFPRHLEKIKEVHKKVWELLSAEHMGALKRPSETGYKRGKKTVGGGYCYDDRRCGVRWKIIVPERFWSVYPEESIMKNL